MTQHKILAIDLAKNVFQVCGLNRANSVTFNKQINRNALPDFIAQQAPTTIAMEACYSSHHWARLFSSYGHRVLLIPAQHVKPFVRGNKNDHNDAIAIAEAAQRPNITPVPIKTVEQQDIQSLHRLRDRYVAKRTSLMNQARGLLAEYGIVSPQGHKAFCALLHRVSEAGSHELSPLLRPHFRAIADDYYLLCDRIQEIQHTLQSLAETNPHCQILMSIPGIGLVNATAIYSAIGCGEQFQSAREFAVWLGLTPKQHSSGERQKTGGISKRGNRYLRKQLVHGARAAVSRSKTKTDALSVWINKLVARRGVQKAYVAMAARMARLAWILLQKHECYRTQ